MDIRGLLPFLHTPAVELTAWCPSTGHYGCNVQPAPGCLPALVTLLSVPFKGWYTTDRVGSLVGE